MHCKTWKMNRNWPCLDQQRIAMHHHTENESSLFSSLSVSVFFLCLSLCLCLSLFSWSVVVVLLWCVVVCCVLCCGVCAVWCGVTRWKTRTHVSTCARGASTHGDVLNLHTEGVLYIHRGCRGSSFVLLTKICPHMGFHVLQKFTKETLGSHKNWEWSELYHWTLRSCPLPCTHHTKQGTLFRLFVQRPSRHFFLALSSSIFLWPHHGRDHDTTTKDHHDNDMSTTPHHTTPHPTTHPTTTRDTRHDTAPHNKKTKTHTYTHMYMSMSHILFISHEKKNGLEHVPSMMFTVPSFWPSTMVERSILDTSADMTNHTAGKTVYQKKISRPGQKL